MITIITYNKSLHVKNHLYYQNMQTLSKNQQKTFVGHT